jgi:hypothetical protein
MVNVVHSDKAGLEVAQARGRFKLNGSAYVNFRQLLTNHPLCFAYFYSDKHYLIDFPLLNPKHNVQRLNNPQNPLHSEFNNNPPRNLALLKLIQYAK